MRITQEIRRQEGMSFIQVFDSGGNQVTFGPAVFVGLQAFTYPGGRK